eukprot:6107978-Amphidinium_carterae.2
MRTYLPQVCCKGIECIPSQLFCALLHLCCVILNILEIESLKDFLCFMLPQVAQNLTTAHGAMVQLIPGWHPQTSC